MAATGCFHDSFEPEPDSDLTDRNALSVTMVREAEPETRALLLDSPGFKMESRWVAGDRLGVYGDKSGENVLYEVTEGEITFNGKDLLAMKPEDRAREATENKERAEARAREIKLREEAAKQAYEDMTRKDESK